MSEGENDGEMNISEYSSLLDRTITSWIDEQSLNQVKTKIGCHLIITFTQGIMCRTTNNS